MTSFGLGIDGPYSLERIGMIERFMNHILFEKVYDVYEDIGISDLTDVELDYIKNNLGYDYDHICGLIKFYGKIDEN